MNITLEDLGNYLYRIIIFYGFRPFISQAEFKRIINNSFDVETFSDLNAEEKLLFCSIFSGTVQRLAAKKARVLLNRRRNSKRAPIISKSGTIGSQLVFGEDDLHMTILRTGELIQSANEEVISPSGKEAVRALCFLCSGRNG